MKPWDYIYLASEHAYSLYRHIFNTDNLRKSLLDTQNPRQTFIESFVSLLQNDGEAAELIKVKCTAGHNHLKNVRRVAFTIFNIKSKNYISQIKDKFRQSKIEKNKSKRKKSDGNASANNKAVGKAKSKGARKIQKLSSE